jgi:3-phenylpropionate/trans-cinnamate dioxygenase ferredoxin reductase component
MERTTLIVGAGLAGSRCAETLRAEGYDGRVVLVGEEQWPPYERPALSKQFLAGTRSCETIGLRPDGFWQQQQVELLLGTRVARIDARSRSAFTGDDRILAWDRLVVATGAHARTLPGLPTGVHVLRTLADALALRPALRPGRRLAVIGAGFIGGEVATSASSLGVAVNVIEAGAVPFERVLGRDAGLLIAARYREQGIGLRLNVRLTGFRRGPGDRLRSLRLDDGSEVACDAAVLGIGAQPVAPIGVPGYASGIPTDACGRTTLPDVYACGDVASTMRPSLGRRIHVEHWTSAAAQGAAVARAILGRQEPHDEPPFFWSDQLGLRLQYVGHGEDWTRVEIDGDTDSFSVRYLSADGVPVAALFANRPVEAASMRRELAA